MASKLIRLAENLAIDESLCDESSELSLVDDQEELECVHGQLQINSSTDDKQTILYQKCNDEETGCGVTTSPGYLESQCLASEAVHFEVVRARIVKEGRSKYVVYTMVILRTTEQTESSHAVIERRYSDLETFYQRLKKRFPDTMEQITFPRKVLAGNFDQKLIAERSRGFEQFLSHINSFGEIRFCAEFADFFYAKDLKRAHEYVREGQYEESIPLFMNTLTLQEQLLGRHHKEVVSTLCGVVAVYNAMDNAPESCKYALIALQRIGKAENNRYLIPLLQTAIRLCWRLGKDKTDLEERLADLKKRRFPVDLAPSLMGITLQKFAD